MLVLLLGIAAFFGVHSVRIVAAGWRQRTIDKIGLGAWKGGYSVLALVGLTLLVFGYGAARTTPVIVYAPPFWLRHVALLMLVPVFPLILSVYLPGRIKRMAKHPMLVAVKLWAMAHLLANGMLADVLLFGAFLVWAVLDRISMKRRPPSTVPSAPPGRFNDVIAVVAGLALYVAFIMKLHRVITGIDPL